MTVRDLMSRNVLVCKADDTLEYVIRLLRNGDCGVVPVLDSARRLLGMITDRDICMHLLLRDGRPSEFCAQEVMTSNVYCVGPHDQLRRALDIMRRKRVRRLPVVGHDKTLRGIISMNDVILATGSRHGPLERLACEPVMKALRGICAHVVGEEAPGRLALRESEDSADGTERGHPPVVLQD